MGYVFVGKEKELVKNTAIITFGKLCTQMVSFLLLPLYTTALSAEEYGIIDLAMTYSSLFLPFITLALEQGLFRFLIDVRGNKEKASQYISTVIFVSVVMNGFMLIMIGIIGAISGNELFFYFFLVLIGTVSSTVSLQIARGLGDTVGYTIGSAVTAIVQLICSVLFLFIFHYGASGMMLATGIGGIVCGIIICFRCNVKSFFRFKYVNKDALGSLLNYSLPLIPNQLSWWALNASDRVIVHCFIGIAGNGLLAVANKFSGMYIQFSNIFNISWTESAAVHFGDKDAELFFNQTINIVYRLFMSVCCGIISCMPFVFPFMVNGQFGDSYGLIPIFMVASLFNVVVSLYGVIYVAHKKTVEIGKTALFAASLNVVSHLVLIHFIGIYAAAVSTAIGYGGMAVYRYFHSRKYMTIKFTRPTVFQTMFMLCASVIPYYIGIKSVQLIGFIFVITGSVLFNKDIISDVRRMLKKK